MQTVYRNFVYDTRAEARKLLDSYGRLMQLNVLWAGTPNYDAEITQQEIDSDAVFLASGLTVQNLADVEFSLATIKTNIENALEALTVLANLP